ncbi:MAG: succinate dehydrogenase assembly factor 4 [Gammaproteobacteria bacterium]
MSKRERKTDQHPKEQSPQPARSGAKPDRPKEIGGRTGPEPTRFGDWEKNGRCIDF